MSEQLAQVMHGKSEHVVCAIFQWGHAFFVALSPMNGGPTAVVTSNSVRCGLW